MPRDDSPTGVLKGKKFYLEAGVSCGSARNIAHRYAKFVSMHGAKETATPADADIVLVDTCAFNETAERQSLDVIRQSEARAKPGAAVIVSGCLTAMNPQKLRAHFRGDFFSPKDERHLAAILGVDGEAELFAGPDEPAVRSLAGDRYISESFFARMIMGLKRAVFCLDRRLPLSRIAALDSLMVMSRGLDPRAHSITVSQGCLGNCSFCTIPLAKGRTTSVPHGLIVERVRSLMADGVRDIYLTSEDTGAYGQDIGSSIIRLLQAVHGVPGAARFYIQFFDPRWIRPYRDGLFEILARGRISYLQLPLQSGSDAILKRMRRVYLIGQVLPAIRELREAFPRLKLATDFIIGFPGETEGDFEATRAIVRENLFDRVNIYEFSPRPGAATENMDGHLPHGEIARRKRVLRRDLRFTSRLLY